MKPQEYAEKAKVWCSRFNDPVVIRRDINPGEWTAWHGYFAFHRMKWSAGQMAGLANSFTVPAAFPWDFDDTYSEYDARDRDQKAKDERLQSMPSPERRAEIVANIAKLVADFRRRNPNFMQRNPRADWEAAMRERMKDFSGVLAEFIDILSQRPDLADKATEAERRRKRDGWPAIAQELYELYVRSRQPPREAAQ